MSLRPEPLPVGWYDTLEDERRRAAEAAGDDCLVTACIQHPERAKALAGAFADESLRRAARAQQRMFNVLEPALTRAEALTDKIHRAAELCREAEREDADDSRD